MTKSTAPAAAPVAPTLEPKRCLSCVRALHAENERLRTCNKDAQRHEFTGCEAVRCDERLEPNANTSN